MTARPGRWALLATAVGLSLTACAPAVSPPPAVTQAPPRAPEPPPPSPRVRLAAPHNEQAAKLEQEGQLRQALDERRIALTIYPDDATARAALVKLEATIERTMAQRIEEGRAALARGSHVEARRRFLAALAIDPTNQTAFRALQEDVRDVEFIAHTIRAGETLASLAQRYYGDPARAEVIWETNELAPAARLVAGRTLKIPEIPGLPFSRPEPPRPQTPRPSVTPPPPSPEPAPTPAAPPVAAPVEVNPLLTEAQDAFERRDYKGALADLDKMLASSPGNTDAVNLKKQVLYVHGKAQLDANDYEGSYRTLNQLVKLAPNYENAGTLTAQARGRLIEQRYSQGIRYFREERLQEAVAAWRAVLELDPQHANARKNIEQSERLIKGLEERRKK